MLAAAQAAHEADTDAAVPADNGRAREQKTPNGRTPAIKAKGLERNAEKQPLTYSAPDLGSETPRVSSDEAEASKAGSATARRQQSRGSNPNRGSRGNKRSSGGGGNRAKRKR
jgi:hypothetical protein